MLFTAQVVIAQTSKLLEEFYPEHVLQRLRRPEYAFWDDCHLEPGDWQGACLCCCFCYCVPTLLYILSSDSLSACIANDIVSQLNY